MAIQNARRASDLDKHIGRQVRLQRIRSGITQEGLAEATDLTRQQIQKYESGHDRIPASRLFHMSCAMSVEIATFFAGANDAA